MRRIEYWLLGAVAALIVFIAFRAISPIGGRHGFDIARHGEAPLVSVSSARQASSDTTDENAESFATSPADVHSAMRRSSAPKPVRDLNDIRRRIRAGTAGSYIVDMLEQQDSVLYRWADLRGQPLRVWIEDNPKVSGWWIGYVQSAREAFAEWQGAGLPIPIQYL